MPEKKPERRAAAAPTVTKENKEPKESKETKGAALKEDKVTDSESEKEPKETPNAKVVIYIIVNIYLVQAGTACGLITYLKIVMVLIGLV